MLTQERRDIITRIVNEKNAVTVAELVEELETSAATIRRDLTELDKEHRIVKVFGGATSVGSINTGEDAVKEKLFKNVEAKDEISRYAASLIVNDDFVYIDSGTTTLKLIDYITNTKAKYITNGITLKAGFTTPDVDEAMVKAEAIKHSYMSYILADHSKFGVVSSVTFAELKTCAIITDKEPSKQYTDETVIKFFQQ